MKAMKSRKKYWKKFTPPHQKKKLNENKEKNQKIKIKQKKIKEKNVKNRKKN